MVKDYRKPILLLMSLLVLYLAGCAASAPEKQRSRRAMRVPPGLDSMTVARASRMGDASFVSARREAEAENLVKQSKARMKKVDEFWAYLDGKVKKGRLSRTEQAQFDKAYADGANALARWKELTNNGRNEAAARSALQYCEQARQHLERAVKLNPFDKNARLLLSVTYYNLQHIFGQDNNYERAVEILERLTRIEKGEHDLFRLLAENYMELKDYDSALENFRKAEMVLVKTSFDAPPDTSTLYYYTYMQGDMFARKYDARSALAMFNKAKKLARTKDERADAENYIKWINWDGGNIRAAEAWDQILNLENKKAYREMAQAATALLPKLRTRKASLTVHHRLAVVEFEFLNRKAQAIERMRRVFESIPLAARQKPDELTTAWLDTYGAMLYRFGVEARERREKKIALAYFTKAANFKWNEVAKAHFELMTLLWNSPEKAIAHGKKALAQANGLDKAQRCELLSLLVKAHKSAGLYDEARGYFTQWKQCQRGTTHVTE